MASVKWFITGWSWPAALVALAWVVCGSAAFMAWGPVAQPIQFTDKVSVKPETIRPGEVVVITREFVVSKPTVLTVTRNLVPIGTGPVRPVYALPESRVLWNTGTYNNPRAHEIPDYVVPGRYRFDVVATWEVNMFRRETRALPGVEFEVVAR